MGEIEARAALGFIACTYCLNARNVSNKPVRGAMEALIIRGGDSWWMCEN